MKPRYSAPSIPCFLIAAIEEAFRERYPSVIIQPRTVIELPLGVFLIMPCSDQYGHSLGLKLVLVSNAPRHGEERVRATYLLLDPESTKPCLTIEATI